MRHLRGVTLMEGVVGLGLIALLSTGFATMMNRGNRMQRRELVLNSGFDLETRARAALQSGQAMRFSTQSSAALGNCLNSTCAHNTPFRIELRDAANRVVIPLVATGALQIQDQLVGGNTVACTAPATRTDCVWDVYAEARPLCPTGASCVAPMFQVNVEIVWHQQGRATAPSASRRVEVVVPREWMVAPPNFADGLCNVGFYFAGFDNNGAKMCSIPVGPGLTGDQGVAGANGTCLGPPAPCAPAALACPATCSCP